MKNREIDALVAEKVFGWIIKPNVYDTRSQDELTPHYDLGIVSNDGHIKSMVPQFTNQPAASKQLRDRMRELGWYVRLEGTPHGKHVGTMWGNGDVFTERSGTEEMAVALAALAARGVKVPQ